MRALASADGPVQLHASTAAALERRLLIESADGGYVLTELGRQVNRNEARARAERAIAGDFPAELRERLQLTLLWLEFTKKADPFRHKPGGG